MEFIEGEECGIGLYRSDLYSGKRIFCNPIVCKSPVGDFLQTFHVTRHCVLLLVTVNLEIHLKTVDEIAVKTCQWQVFDFILLFDVTLEQSGNGLVFLDGAELEIAAHQCTAFLIVFLKCRYYHTFHYLVDTDIEKSVVKFLRGCDNTFRLHILKQLEQLDIRLVDIVVQIYRVFGRAFGAFL